MPTIKRAGPETPTCHEPRRRTVISDIYGGYTAAGGRYPRRIMAFSWWARAVATLAAQHGAAFGRRRPCS
jgi:hypothetical protein